MTSVEDAIAAGNFGAPVAAPASKDALPRVGFTPRVTPTLERRRLWERRYRLRLWLTDYIVVLVATVLTAFIQIQVRDPELLLSDPWILARIPVVAALTWLVMLAAFHTRDPRIAGSGATEYKRVLHATRPRLRHPRHAFVIFQWQGIRDAAHHRAACRRARAAGERWMWRQWLTRQRRFGHYVSRAIVVGRPRRCRVRHRHARSGPARSGTSWSARRSTSEPTPDTHQSAAAATASSARANTVAQTANALGADTIIVASRPDGDPDFIKQLSWQLEGTASELVLSSRLTDVAGPRISLRQVDGLPLIHVKIPTFEGGQHVLKRALDVVRRERRAHPDRAVLLPFIALAIKLDSRGPVFFRQERVGRDGREFKMLKFRSMRRPPRRSSPALLAANEGAGPLFKLKDDPRVTRVGRSCASSRSTSCPSSGTCSSAR